MSATGKLNYIAVWCRLCAIQWWYDISLSRLGHSIRITDIEKLHISVK